MPSLPSASTVASRRRCMSSRYSFATVAEELRARLDDLADLVRDLTLSGKMRLRESAETLEREPRLLTPSSKGPPSKIECENRNGLASAYSTRVMMLITFENRSAPSHDTHADTSRERRDAGGPAGPNRPGLTPNYIGGLDGVALLRGTWAPS